MKCSDIYISRHGVRPSQVPAQFALSDEPYDRPAYDEPLSSLGRRQAEALAEHLADVALDFIFCSPYYRTIQTVVPLARRLGLPIKLEWGLGEFLHTDWFERTPLLPTPAQYQIEFPEIDGDYQSAVTPQYPETTEDFQARISQTVTALTHNFGPAIFLMGHGATSISARRALLGGDEPLIADFAGVSHLSQSGDKWHCVRDGNSDYLDEIQVLDRE